MVDASIFGFELMNFITLITLNPPLTIILFGLIQFLLLLVLPQPYGGKFVEKGRTGKERNVFVRSYLYLLSFRIPSRLAWFLQEIPALLFPVYYAYFYWKSLQLPNKVLLSGFIGHYFHRAIVYPVLMNKSSKPMPIITSILAFLFCAFNGWMQSMGLVTSVFADNYFQSYSFLTGISIFVFGLCVNIQSDSILRYFETYFGIMR